MLAEHPRLLRILIGAACAAVVLRVLWALLVPIAPVSDAAAYQTFALNLYEHGVYGFEKETPHAYWPPGTALIYAAAYYVVGYHPAVNVALNVLMSLLLLFVSARVALRFFGEEVATWTVVVLAVWPTLIMLSTLIVSEIPYVLLTLAALDAWTCRHRTWLFRGLVAGLLLGSATLVRPSALVLPLLFAGCEFVRAASRPRLIEQVGVTALAFGAMALVILPWSYRNYQLFDEPVLVSTNGGVTLWMGNHPGTDGSFAHLPEYVHDVPEVERDRILREEAREYIMSDPLAFAGRAVKKLTLLYFNESVGVGWNDGVRQTYGDGTSHALKRTTQATWALILLLAAAGLLAEARRHGYLAVLLSPVVALIVFHTMIHAVVVAQERYHLGFAAEIAIFAGAGLRALFGAELTRRFSRASS